MQVSSLFGILFDLTYSNNPAHLLESFVLDRTKHFDTIFIHDEEPYYIYFREYGRENKSNLKTSREDIFFVCFSILDKKSFTKTKKVCR